MDDAGGRNLDRSLKNPVLCGKCKRAVSDSVPCVECGDVYHPSCLKYHLLSCRSQNKAKTPDPTGDLTNVFTFDQNGIDKLCTNIKIAIENSFLSIVNNLEGEISSLKTANELLFNEVSYLRDQNKQIIDMLQGKSDDKSIGNRAQKSYLNENNNNKKEKRINSDADSKPANKKLQRSHNLSGSSTNVVMSSIEEVSATSTKNKNNNKSLNVNIEPVDVSTSAAEEQGVNNFTTVSYKRSKHKRKPALIIGTAVKNSRTFISTPTHLLMSIHLTRVSTEARKEDIEEYIQEELKILHPESETFDIKLEKLNSRYPDKYSSFKITCPKIYYSNLIDNKFWPNGIAVKRYFTRVNPGDKSRDAQTNFPQGKSITNIK